MSWGGLILLPGETVKTALDGGPEVLAAYPCRQPSNRSALEESKKLL